jgi:hypothetical protein
LADQAQSVLPSTKTQTAMNILAGCVMMEIGIALLNTQ